MQKEKNCTVRICENYVRREPDKVNEILERVSKIISNSYIGVKK
jgi:competence transcription factor ComK